MIFKTPVLTYFDNLIEKLNCLVNPNCKASMRMQKIYWKHGFETRRGNFSNWLTLLSNFLNLMNRLLILASWFWPPSNIHDLRKVIVEDKKKLNIPLPRKFKSLCVFEKQLSELSEQLERSRKEKSEALL